MVGVGEPIFILDINQRQSIIQWVVRRLGQYQSFFGVLNCHKFDERLRGIARKVDVPRFCRLLFRRSIFCDIAVIHRRKLRGRILMKTWKNDTVSRFASWCGQKPASHRAVSWYHIGFWSLSHQCIVRVMLNHEGLPIFKHLCSVSDCVGDKIRGEVDGIG